MLTARINFSYNGLDIKDQLITLPCAPNVGNTMLIEDLKHDNGEDVECSVFEVVDVRWLTNNSSHRLEFVSLAILVKEL